MRKTPALGSPVLLVLVAIVSVQAGAAIAKGLFHEVSPSQMVWLRLATSALILSVIARPAVRGRSRGDWLTVLGFAACLAGMNWAIYESFARIPLGVAVTIEFVGPLGLAVLGSRRARDFLWVVLAGCGVVALGWEGGDLDPVGLVFAVVAGLCWAGYILLSARTGARWPGLVGLSVASLIGAAALTPIALAQHFDAVPGSASRYVGELADPRVLGIGLAVGLLSSVIPYSCEIVALRSIRPGVFSILMSLEPAAAALAAMLLLGEFLTPIQWLAMGLVVIASVGATRAGPG